MKRNKLQLVLFSLIIVFSFTFVSPSQADSHLSGRILLQVEEHGEAWYLNPTDSKRYYLGRPEDAFLLMSSLGLGVSNQDLAQFRQSLAPSRLAGRILLQVEANGEAYYVNPLDLKLYFLGRPADAFALMRNFGLGISNANLAKIEPALSPEIRANEISLEPELAQNNSFTFRYQGQEQTINLSLYDRTYASYQDLPKVLTYLVSEPPIDKQAAFYDIFLKPEPAEVVLDQIVDQLTALAKVNNYNSDQLAELAIAFVQYIPYDYDKALLDTLIPNYSFETLYLNKGICSDTTFLLYKLLAKLGYGVAIIDMPDLNHNAIGLACPQEYSLGNSGYCYVETTNYFPVSVVPQSISGQANLTNFPSKEIFSDSSLGDYTIRNKSQGKAFQSLSQIQSQGYHLAELYQEIKAIDILGASRYQILYYNALVKEYNLLLGSFYQLD